MSNMSAEEALQKIEAHVLSKHSEVVREAKDLPEGLSTIAKANKLLGQAVAYKDVFEYIKLIRSVL